MHANASQIELLPQAFMAASSLTAYPDEGAIAFLREISETTGLNKVLSVTGNEWGGLANEIEETLKTEAKLSQLQSDYIQLFDWGKRLLSLYETEYGPRGKTQWLSDIAGFYKAFGLNFGDKGATLEAVDHISVQLEFYAILLLKSAFLKKEKDQEGQNIVSDAKRKFLRDHLGAFIGVLSGRPAISLHPFYSSVFGWVRALVETECKIHQVHPIQLNSNLAQAETESLACGAFKCSPEGG